MPITGAILHTAAGDDAPGSRYVSDAASSITWAELGIYLIIVCGAFLGAAKRYAPLPEGVVSALYDALVYGTLMYIVLRRIMASRVIYKTPVMLPLLLFSAYSIFTIFFPHYYSLVQGALGWRFMTSSLLLYFAGLWGFRSVARIERMLTVFWIIALLVALYGLLQFGRGYTPIELAWINNLASTMRIAGTGEYRLMSTMGSAQDLGFFLALAFVSLLGHILFFAKRRRSYMFALGVIGVVLLFTYVRAAWVAAFVASLYLLTVRIWQYRRLRLLMPAIVILGILVVATLSFAVSSLASLSENPALRERVGSLSNPLTDASMLDRYERWQEIGAEIRAYPLGTGTGTTGATSLKFPDRGFLVTVDNSYLKVLLETGWIGFFLFLALIASVLRSQTRDARRLPYAGKALVQIFTATTIVYVVILLFGEYIELNPGRTLIWILIGTSNSIPFLLTSRNERKSHANPVNQPYS